MVTQRDIAADQLEYLRNYSDVCAEGNVHGWRWVRFHDGTMEWRATDYGGQHRLKRYVKGKVVDEEYVLDWLEAKPVTMIPADNALLWHLKDATVWEEAERQDVFRDFDRCFWCGDSERTTNLTLFETIEQGKCLFCSDCEASWRHADEIVAEVTEP